MGGRNGLGEQPSQATIEAARVPTDSKDVLGPLLSMPCAPPGQHGLPGIVVGELVAILDESGAPLVTYPGQSDTNAVRARSVVPLRGPQIGRSVVLMFECGDARSPIVMGLIQEASAETLTNDGGLAVVDVDGERLTVSAQRELVLRCGKASITLTTFGKVLIQGTYVLSRSTGVNKLMGGSVQLN
ncbi:DUF6484 domain-containing protein [Pelomonas sp. PFR6]|uniref:DUF6484 domain-containing protein n=2 Tax=Roseateles violae TaxID=3058042 RepID=A0ABT8DNS5_9BURK|nr:DUF6484 domain-containing protein [Pelomonas sp. PFR6]